MSCSICIENKRLISCESSSCDFSACESCYKTFILDSTVYASCMECSYSFSREFLIKNFSKKFFENDYRKLKQEILFNKELSLLPATQQDVELELKVQRIKTQIAKLTSDLNSLKHTKPSEKVFIKHCTNSECRGFLSEDLKCGLCNETTCSKCNETKKENHVCNEDTVNTMKLLKNDTKNCPGCGNGVFKIEGCPSMFCTICQTSFDWRTGKKENHTGHNPHYVQYLRENKILERDVNDIQCGRELDRFFYNRITPRDTNISNLVMNLIHIKDVIIPRFENVLNDNKKYRISYLKKEISQSEFKRKIFISEKAFDKKTEICNILRMFITCSTDIMYRFVDERKTSDLVFTNEKYIKELTELVNYTNELFVKTSKIYNCKVYAFTINSLTVRFK